MSTPSSGNQGDSQPNSSNEVAMYRGGQQCRLTNATVSFITEEMDTSASNQEIQMVPSKSQDVDCYPRYTYFSRICHSYYISISFLFILC